MINEEFYKGVQNYPFCTSTAPEKQMCIVNTVNPFLLNTLVISIMNASYGCSPYLFILDEDFYSSDRVLRDRVLRTIMNFSNFFFFFFYFFFYYFFSSF